MLFLFATMCSDSFTTKLNTIIAIEYICIFGT
uniref:Uncharacterized protein n=1 Tax=Siphoviridae sp. ct5jB2 TaxID=2825337 RepID=A0A8S5TTQ7_9CAUD|nr:MAG TPA: hypothetical protein [Siphoviridae sp. ct5jB2]